MVVNNTCSEIGDVLLFTFVEPIVGIVALTGYTDVTTGETGTAFFKKEFSYSTNGIFFSDWLTLTNQNVQAIQLDSHSLLYVNYKYTRAGTEVQGLIGFTSVNLTGTFSLPVCTNYFALPNSIFKEFYCFNPQHLGLCAILTRKCYEAGIVPIFIERFNEDPAVVDKDYIAFWDAVCCFYSLLILFARKFEVIDTDVEMLKRYVEQKGLFFCDSISQSDLIYLKENYFDEVRQRGTLQVFLPKSIDKLVDGEFLRLICKSSNDEFIFNLVRQEKFGWCINSASPLYKGTGAQMQLNKTPENTQNFTDIAKYSLFGSTFSTITATADTTKNVLKIFNTQVGKTSGIAPNLDNLTLTDYTKLIIVDPGLDYEITFQVCQTVLAETLTFGCVGFDKNNGFVSMKSDFDASPTNYFFERKGFKRNDKYYFVRGILFNKDKKNWTWSSTTTYFKDEKVILGGLQYVCTKISSINENPSVTPLIWKLDPGDDSKLNVGFGNHLTMSATIAKIYPIILNDRTSELTTGGDTRIWDFKIRPLVTGNCANKIREYSTTYHTFITKKSAFSSGYIQTKNIINCYYKNNNNQKNNEEIDDLNRHFLLPYNTTQQNIYL